MIGVCVQECRCGQRNMKFYRHNVLNLDPKEPLARYFAFPAGTEKRVPKGKTVKQLDCEEAQMAAELNRKKKAKEATLAQEKAEAEAEKKAEEEALKKAREEEEEKKKKVKPAV